MTACGNCIRYGVRTDLPDTGECPFCLRHSNWCRGCGGPVEPVRWIYATPTCFTCLAPPEPIEVVKITGGGA